MIEKPKISSNLFVSSNQFRYSSSPTYLISLPFSLKILWKTWGYSFTFDILVKSFLFVTSAQKKKKIFIWNDWKSFLSDFLLPVDASVFHDWLVKNSFLNQKDDTYFNEFQTLKMKQISQFLCWIFHFEECFLCDEWGKR